MCRKCELLKKLLFMALEDNSEISSIENVERGSALDSHAQDAFILDAIKTMLLPGELEYLSQSDVIKYMSGVYYRAQVVRSLCRLEEAGCICIEDLGHRRAKRVRLAAD
jgi:hypothetical protein